MYKALSVRIRNLAFSNGNTFSVNANEVYFVWTHFSYFRCVCILVAELVQQSFQEPKYGETCKQQPFSGCIEPYFYGQWRKFPFIGQMPVLGIYLNVKRFRICIRSIHFGQVVVMFYKMKVEDVLWVLFSCFEDNFGCLNVSRLFSRWNDVSSNLRTKRCFSIVFWASWQFIVWNVEYCNIESGTFLHCYNQLKI